MVNISNLYVSLKLHYTRGYKFSVFALFDFSIDEMVGA